MEIYVNAPDNPVQGRRVSSTRRRESLDECPFNKFTTRVILFTVWNTSTAFFSLLIY